jgi:hypothetical protein
MSKPTLLASRLRLYRALRQLIGPATAYRVTFGWRNAA